MDTKKLIEQVKRLRQEMGLGMMEIKMALEEANGDERKAKQILKEKGYKKAEKRADKETHEGRVFCYEHGNGKLAVMVELLCETDFVAKNDDFVRLGKDLCLQVAGMSPRDSQELLEQDFVKDGSKKVGDLVKEFIAKSGENVKVGRIERFEIC
ncbi:translation elongation factor Ts [Candidatus Shapirobacteria bacterium]|nr:MAG: translation elongation factor Ts [Candidatus Shapirobacteria bacterium]